MKSKGDKVTALSNRGGGVSKGDQGVIISGPTGWSGLYTVRFSNGSELSGLAYDKDIA
jgi:hypothetical protein